eukprot:15453740-Alexandrium_andersonii.AAC.1
MARTHACASCNCSLNPPSALSGGSAGPPRGPGRGPMSCATRTSRASQRSTRLRGGALRSAPASRKGLLRLFS